MTGEEIATLATVGTFTFGITTVALWQMEAWLTRQRRKPRFEPPRSPVDKPVDEPTADLTCPGCHRSNGHDAACYVRRQERRASEITIPRDGETA